MSAKPLHDVDSARPQPAKVQAINHTAAGATRGSHTIGVVAVRRTAAGAKQKGPADSTGHRAEQLAEQLASARGVRRSGYPADQGLLEAL